MNIKEFTSEFRRIVSLGYHTLEIKISNSNDPDDDPKDVIYADDFYYLPSESNLIRLLRKTWIVAVVHLDDVVIIDGYYDGVDVQ